MGVLAQDGAACCTGVVVHGVVSPPVSAVSHLRSSGLTMSYFTEQERKAPSRGNGLFMGGSSWLRISPWPTAEDSQEFSSC
jgi:hypothetical protein